MVDFDLKGYFVVFFWDNTEEMRDKIHSLYSVQEYVLKLSQT